MPETDAENGSPAGISTPDSSDVAALFERLKAEVRRGEPTPSAAQVSAAPPAEARAQAERVWPVTFDQPLHVRPGVRGRLALPVKRTVRRLVRWYVEPVALDQRTFNGALLELVDGLYERTGAAQRQLDAGLAALGETVRRVEAESKRLAAELELRVTRVERRGESSPPTTVASQPRAEAVPDYFAFEARMRGSPELIRDRQRAYVDDFRDREPVLDLGCGRGEFVGLLREAGIEARGVDADSDMVAYARGEGLDVTQADALEELERLPDESLGGVFAAQLLEHLPPAVLVRLLALTHAKLRPGGAFVAETINPLSPTALRHYFADLTHAQPLVPETLVLLVRDAGFSDADVRYLNEPPARERLHAVELPPDPAFDGARAALAHNVERVNSQLFAPLDYAVVAVR